MKSSILATTSLVALLTATPLAFAQMEPQATPVPAEQGVGTPPAAPAQPDAMGQPGGTGMSGAAALPGDSAALEAPGMVTAEAFEDLAAKNSAGTEIGTVRDVVLDQQGAISGLVVSEGGILGVGARRVLVPAAEIQPEQGADGTLAAVTLTTAGDNLEKFPTFSYDAANAEPGTQTLAATDNSATTLIGSAVKTSDGEEVGTIDALILDLPGKTAKATIESGGLMGVNAKRVVVAMNDLTISKDEDQDVTVQIERSVLDRAPNLGG